MTGRAFRWFTRGLLAGGLALAGTVSALAAGGLISALIDAGPQVEETPIVVEPTPTGTEEPDGANNDGATDDLDDGQVDDIDDGAVDDVDDGQVDDLDDGQVDDVDDGQVDDHDDGDVDDLDDDAGAVKSLTITLA